MTTGTILYDLELALHRLRQTERDGAVLSAELGAVLDESDPDLLALALAEAELLRAAYRERLASAWRALRDFRGPVLWEELP